MHSANKKSTWMWKYNFGSKKNTLVLNIAGACNGSMAQLILTTQNIFVFLEDITCVLAILSPIKSRRVISALITHGINVRLEREAIMWRANGEEKFDREIVIWKMISGTTFIKIVLANSFHFKGITSYIQCGCISCKDTSQLHCSLLLHRKTKLYMKLNIRVLHSSASKEYNKSYFNADKT